MSVSPLAGKPADPSLLVNVPRLITAYYTERPGPVSAGAARRLRHLGPSRLVAGARLQRVAHPGDHAGHLPLSQGQQRIGGPLFLGIDTHALSVPAIRQRARGAGRQRRRRDDRRRRGVHADARRVARHPHLQPRPHQRSAPTASSSRRRTTRPTAAASSTTRPTAGRPRPRSRAGSRARPTSCSKAGCKGVRRVPYERALRASTTHHHDYLDAYVADLGSVIDMDAIRGAALAPRRRSARRRRRALLGADRRALRARPHRRQRRGRSDLPLHDRRLGRQDPHGPVLAVRHAAPHRAEGPLRHRLRRRHRPRSPRHRRQERRPAAAEPLPVGDDRVPVPPPAAVARRRRGRQDGGQQQHDRPRRRQARPPPVRGAGRVQVLRRRPGRRLARLRRRRERRRIVPAPRRRRCGRPTRTASFPACLRPRSPPCWAAIPARSTAI